MYELYIYKNSLWLELELSRSSNFSFVINSLLFGQKQSGSFSFSSSLDTTSTNCQVLQHSEEPQIIIEELQEYPAMLLYNSKKVYGDWWFVLKEAGRKEYKFDLIQNPANQPKSFYEKKLNQLSLGSLPLSVVENIVKSNIWSCSDSNKIKSYFLGLEFPYSRNYNIPGKHGFHFDLLINDIIVAQTQYDASWIDMSTTSLVDRFNALLAEKISINDYVVTCNVNANNEYSLNVIVNNNTVVHSIILKIYNFLTYSPPNDTRIYYSTARTNTLTTHELIPFNVCTYNTSPKETIQTLVATQESYPFRFIQYYNDSFYPSDDTAFEGIVNQYNSDGTLKLCSDNQRTSYPISPCFSFKWITETVADLMGFQVVSDIFDSTNSTEPFYLGDLYLINNCDLAQQLDSTTIPYNVYPDTLHYNYFMPDLTAKEWIDGLRNTFALDITYDYTNMVMNIKRAKQVINSSNYQDLTNKFVRFPTKTTTERKNYKLTYRGADDKILFLDSYPAKVTLNSNLVYTDIESTFIPVINNKDKDSTLTEDINAGIPTADGQAKTVLYLDQKTVTPEIRMCFLIGVGTRTFADNNNAILSLSFADKNQVPGMFKIFFQDYLAFLNKTNQWTGFVSLTEDELLNIDLSAPVIAFDVPFLIETIQPKFPAKDVTQVKLLSL